MTNATFGATYNISTMFNDSVTMPTTMSQEPQITVEATLTPSVNENACNVPPAASNAIVEPTPQQLARDKYYATHRNEILAQAKVAYALHREKRLAQMKQNYLLNKANINQRHRAYYRQNPERHKLYMRQWRLLRKQAKTAAIQVPTASIWFDNGRWHRKCPTCVRTVSYKLESTVRRNISDNKPCYVCTYKLRSVPIYSTKGVQEPEQAPAVQRIEIAHFTVGSVEWVSAVSQNICLGFTSNTLPKEQHEVYWSTLKRNILSHSGCKTLESVCD